LQAARATISPRFSFVRTGRRVTAVVRESLVLVTSPSTRLRPDGLPIDVPPPVAILTDS
jgi:hypothetical protein